MATSLLKANKENTKGTDYSENIASGVKYDTQKEAIMANAKQYAKLDWTTIEIMVQSMIAKGIIKPTAKRTINDIMVEFSIELIEAKAVIIRNSIEKRGNIDKLFA